MALSSSVISSKHDKLVWTLNFYVIEMTSKFVGDSDELIVDSIISANNILKRTGDHTLFHLIVNVSISTFLHISTFPLDEAISSHIKRAT